MTTWVVFIPRAREIADKEDVDKTSSLLAQAKAWATHSNGKLDAANVFCVGDTLPGVMASPGTNLYIMGGHGKEGRNYLSWPGESNPLCCHQLGEALVQAGLPLDFAGKIKLYSCLSADSRGSSVAFAKLVALRMAKLGYRHCTVWGYTGAVSKAYVNSGSVGQPLGLVARLKFKEPGELNKGWHRYATVVGGYGPRAKDARRDFTVCASTDGSQLQEPACSVCGRT